MSYRVPHRLSIEFTNACNFACPVCPQTSSYYTREVGYVSDEVFEAFLCEARKYASCVSLGFFGEQSLHPKFGEYLTRLARNRPYKLILFSNFSQFDENTFKTVMNCDVVKISTNIEHPKSIENVEKWLEIPNHPKTYLVYVITADKVDEKKDFLDKWLPKLSKNDGIIAKTVITYGGLISDDYMASHPCNVLKKPRLVVSWNGDVSPCNLDVNMVLSVGNILDDTLEEIVESPFYYHELNTIRDKQSICGKCFDSNNHRHTTIHHGRANA